MKITFDTPITSDSYLQRLFGRFTDNNQILGFAVLERHPTEYICSILIGNHALTSGIIENLRLMFEPTWINLTFD
jgi:hypothetical protein